MRSLLLSLTFLLAASPLLAWTEAAEKRIASKGAQLAPPDLRLLLEKYGEAFERGRAAAAADEAFSPHLFIVEKKRGTLRSELQQQVDQTISMLRRREPLSLVVERLGTIAHLVADANNPFHVADSDPRLAESRADFERYFERRMSKFPTVFYGLDPKFQLVPYIDRTLARSARFYPILSEEYFRFGERRTSADFDDRSTAFGIASVSYSRAVTDIANVYYHIWREAGGDVRSASVMQKGTLLLNGSD